MANANPEKLKLIKDFGGKGVLFSIARVPQSSRAFLGSSDFKVYEIDLAEAKPEPKELGGHTSYVTGVALADKTVVSGSYDGRLIWWDTEKRTQIRAVDAHSKWIRRVIVSSDGKIIASVADDMDCRLWDAESGKLLRELRGHKEQTPNHFPSMLYACAFSADGKYLATGDKVGHVVVWETATGKELAMLETPVMYTWDPVQRRHSIGGIRSLAFSPDGKLLAVGGMGKVGNIDHLEGKARVEVFDWQQGERTHEFPGDKFNGLVEQLTFHPQGDWLLGAGGAGDGFLLFFNLQDKKVVRQEKVAMHVHSFALNEDCDTIYAVGHGKIMIFGMHG
jgi:WD40 repeat protein